MKPRGILMIEHRLIEKVLLLVKSEIGNIDQKGTVDPFFVQSIIDFIRTYADRTHHGKEEDILFEQLKTKAMDTDDKLVMDDLIEEHKIARRAVADLIESENRFIAGDKAQLEIIKEKLNFLTDFYPKHIAKEDKMFFPHTERYFTQDELSQMLNDFYEFDRKMIHEKYHRLYESLSAALKE